MSLEQQQKKIGGGGTLQESLGFLVSHKSCHLDFLSKISRFSLVPLTSPATGPKIEEATLNPIYVSEPPWETPVHPRANTSHNAETLHRAVGHPEGAPKDSETPRCEQYEEKSQVPRA